MSRPVLFLASSHEGNRAFVEKALRGVRVGGRRPPSLPAAPRATVPVPSIAARAEEEELPAGRPATEDHPNRIHAVVDAESWTRSSRRGTNESSSTPWIDVFARTCFPGRLETTGAGSRSFFCPPRALHRSEIVDEFLTRPGGQISATLKGRRHLGASACDARVAGTGDGAAHVA